MTRYTLGDANTVKKFVVFMFKLNLVPYEEEGAIKRILGPTSYLSMSRSYMAFKLHGLLNAIEQRKHPR